MADISTNSKLSNFVNKNIPFFKKDISDVKLIPQSHELKWTFNSDKGVCHARVIVKPIQKDLNEVDFKLWRGKLITDDKTIDLNSMQDIPSDIKGSYSFYEKEGRWSIFLPGTVDGVYQELVKEFNLKK